MALNWQLDKIANYKQLCWKGEGQEQRMNAVTNALIWLQIPILMGEITEKNHVEVFKRISMYEKTQGAFVRYHTTGDYFITLKDVKEHIGLKTNVREETFAKFKKELMIRIEREANDDVRRQQRDMEEANA